MALGKRVVLGNGVEVGYHRVVSLNVITNVRNVIEVASYTCAGKREEEKAALAAGEPMDVFVEARLYEAPYDPGMDIEGAYAYVKGLPEFDGAEDLFEERGR